MPFSVKIWHLGHTISQASVSWLGDTEGLARRERLGAGQGPAGNRDRPFPLSLASQQFARTPNLPPGTWPGGAWRRHCRPGESGRQGRVRGRAEPSREAAGASDSRAGKEAGPRPRGRRVRAPEHVRRLRGEVAASERRESPGRRPGGGAVGGRPARASSADTRPAPGSWGTSRRLEQLWPVSGAS